MVHAVMLDPRLWLYLAVIVVFVVSAFIVLVTAVTVLAVVAVFISLARAIQRLHAARSLPSRYGQEADLVLFEEVTGSQPDNLAPEPDPALPAVIPHVGDRTDEWGHLRRDLALIKGTFGPQPVDPFRAPLKPFGCPRKRRKR